MATLRDVARAAGVSVMTASRVLNGEGEAVALATRAGVSAAAARLGYRCNGLARAMRRGRSTQVGAVLLNGTVQPLVNLPAFEYLLGLNAGLEAGGHLLTLVRLEDVDGRQPERVRALAERLLDGFVAISALPVAVRRLLAEGPAPVVWLDALGDEAGSRVHRDEMAAGRDAAGLLIARGRRRIVWLQRSAADGHYACARRLAGARAACEAAGVVLDESLASADRPQVDIDALGERRAAGADGVLMADPSIARAALAAFAALGWRPGAEMGAACCDGDAQLASWWPELSRVAVDRLALGRLAADLLLARLAGAVPAAPAPVRSPLVTGSTA